MLMCSRVTFLDSSLARVTAKMKDGWKHVTASLFLREDWPTVMPIKIVCQLNLALHAHHLDGFEQLIASSFDWQGQICIQCSCSAAGCHNVLGANS